MKNIYHSMSGTSWRNKGERKLIGKNGLPCTGYCFPEKRFPVHVCHLHRSVTISIHPLLTFLVVLTDSKDVSQLPSTHLSPMQEDSTPHLDGQEITAAEPIVEYVQNTSSTSGVSPMVTNGSGPEFFDNSLPYTELDEATIFWLMFYDNPFWQPPD